MHPLTLLPSDDRAIVLICVGCLLVLIGLLFCGSLMVAWARRRVGVRVVVAGTRGKSTTTRLIRAGLGAAGLRAVGRVSGTTPLYLEADGTASVWRRMGRPAIGELEWVMHRAAREGADALVVENMAISSRLSRAVMTSMIRPQLVVITNLRPDHLEEQADELETEAGRLAAFLPVAGASVVTTPETATRQLHTLTSGLGVKLLTAEGAATQGETLRQLAITACAAIVPEHAEVARRAILEQPLSVAAFAPVKVNVFDKNFAFLDAFACNDAESLGLLLDESELDSADVVILNARPDRPLRTAQFMEFLRDRSPASRIVLVGTNLGRGYAARFGLNVEQLAEREPADVLEAVAARVPQGGIAWGIGNEKGLGAGLSKAVRASAC